MSIEDLVFFSQDTNDENNNYSGKNVELGRTLNFESELSYCDYTTKEYNESLGVNDNVGLMESLTNTKYAGFKPIGTFYGNFDGKGYVIKNLYEHNNGNGGLFKSGSGSIKNLEVTGEIICDGDSAGGISAGGNGTIENCISRVNITASGNYIGGISNGGTIYNCQNYGTIKGNQFVGGISARYGTVTNCQNYGEIKGQSRVGGICGYQAAIDSCENHGKISGTSYVGGIIGQSQASKINRCINYSEVEGKDHVAGIEGMGVSDVNCLNFGDVTGGDMVGGIFGNSGITGFSINSGNYGSISGTNLGGIGGNTYSTERSCTLKVLNCFNVGNLNSNGYYGSIIGVKSSANENGLLIENCYWNQDSNIEICGFGKEQNNCIIKNCQFYNKEFMQSQAFVDILNSYVTTYNEEHKSDADFVELLTWKLDEKTNYPVLDL